MERHELQEFVRKHRKDSPSLFERKLWDLAESAPLGGIVPGNSLDDPYLLRVYVSPRDPQFKWLWDHAREYVPIGEYRADLFQKTPRFYLHHFFRGDDDSETHNHPWEFSVSLILTGGYVEQRWNPATKLLETRHLNPGDINVIRRMDFHRVELKAPDRGCWTLFLATGRMEEKNGRDWGFLDPKTEQYTPWKTWVDRRPTPPRG